MKILSFDTSMGACSACIWCDGEIVAHHYETLSRGHAEKLIDIVARLCSHANLTISDFDRLGVTIGPGTFTGQRMGLSAARAMILGTEVKLIGITTLEALGAGVVEAGAGDLIVSVADARRGEVYLQIFDHLVAPLTPPQALSPEKAAKVISEIATDKAVYLVGTGIGLVDQMCARDGVALHKTTAKAQPDALYVAMRASLATLSDGVPSPLYLRAPDAKLPSGAKVMPSGPIG
jgi:tRNA threonylcarbamoyladenosine biosynthesis protein TsaB